MPKNSFDPTINFVFVPYIFLLYLNLIDSIHDLPTHVKNIASN